MVTIKRGKPDTLNAFLTTSLPPSVLDHVRRQFAIGTFARFNPSCELYIHDRPEFYSRSHLEIRQKLDEEGHLAPFLIIEERTQESNALWYIETTEAGLAVEEDCDENDLVKYDNEPTLLRIRPLIVDVGVLHANLSIANTDILESLDQWPYNPHADQEPYTLGVDFENDQSWFPAAYIAASEDEVVFSDDLELRKKFLMGRGQHPDWVVRLKDEIAKSEGLTKDWAVRSEPNENGEFKFQTKYDGDSEKWRNFDPSEIKRGSS